MGGEIQRQRNINITYHIMGIRVSQKLVTQGETDAGGGYSRGQRPPQVGKGTSPAPFTFFCFLLFLERNPPPAYPAWWMFRRNSTTLAVVSRKGSSKSHNPAMPPSVKSTAYIMGLSRRDKVSFHRKMPSMW